MAEDDTPSDSLFTDVERWQKELDDAAMDRVLRWVAAGLASILVILIVLLVL